MFLPQVYIEAPMKTIGNLEYSEIVSTINIKYLMIRKQYRTETMKAKTGAFSTGSVLTKRFFNGEDIFSARSSNTMKKRGLKFLLF